MITGDFARFTVWECIKLALGARLYIQHNGLRMARAVVSFSPPDFVGGIIRSYEVEE